MLALFFLAASGVLCKKGPIALFNADTHLLIPLYAVGVFIAFAMSPASMVRRWAGRREPGWQVSLAFNAVDAATTALVAVVLTITRFLDGAWMVLVILPVFMAIMLGIRSHCERVAVSCTSAHDRGRLPAANPCCGIMHKYGWEFAQVAENARSGEKLGGCST